MPCDNSYFYTELGRFPPAKPNWCRYANERDHVHFWFPSDEFDGWTCGNCCKIASSKVMEQIAYQRRMHEDPIFKETVLNFYLSSRISILPTLKEVEELLVEKEDLQQKEVTVVVEVVEKYDAKAVKSAKAAEKSAKAAEKAAKAAEKSAKAVQKFLVAAKAAAAAAVSAVARPAAMATEVKLVASKPATVVSDNYVPTFTKEHVQRARAATAKRWTKQRKQAAAVKAGL